MGAPPGRTRRRENLPERAITEWNRQRTATQKALCEKYDLENQVRRGQLLDRAEVTKVLAAIAHAMVTRISVADIPRRVKEDLLTELSSIPVSLAEVAPGRLRRANGKQPDEDGSEG